MYYSTMCGDENGQGNTSAAFRFVREIGHRANKKFGSMRGKSVYYSTASRAVLPLVVSYTIGLGQRGLAGILIWAARLGF